MSSRFPFPAYANGWFRAVYSTELAPGEVKPLRMLGREFVLWRDEAGEAHVLDAYCPHLGAHLGHGGKVEGKGLRCPFHSWLWAGDGRCLEIPYAKKIPAKARVRAWPLLERNGVVLVYHHADGEAPTWEPPVLPEIGAAGWSPFEIRHWTVRSRWLDMNENAVDQVHFKYVHGTPAIPEAHVSTDGHIFRCTSHVKMGPEGKGRDGTIETVDYGPAYQVVRIKGFTETLMLYTAIPIDEETTDLSFAYSIHLEDGAVPHDEMWKAMVKNLEHQMELDIEIWENKCYWKRPVLCDGDGQLRVYRRWMKQFFSPGSVDS